MSQLIKLKRLGLLNHWTVLKLPRIGARQTQTSTEVYRSQSMKQNRPCQTQAVPYGPKGTVVSGQYRQCK